MRAGLASIGNDVLAENFPNPNKEERVCFVSFLLRGLGFPIHPFLRGLLEFYGIQLHNLTPGSILHILGFVALCELFLGCEAHFELWRTLNNRSHGHHDKAMHPAPIVQSDHFMVLQQGGRHILL